jgi:acyl-CoA thioester hydrolase
LKAEVMDATSREAYTKWTSVSLRYSDLDGLGHVNNAVFATLFEQGRIPILHDEKGWLEGPGRYWVLAHISIDFRAEIHYPGTIKVGTRLDKIGDSSIRMSQALFQGDKCCATSHAVAVLLDAKTRKSTTIEPEFRALIEKRACLDD